MKLENFYKYLESQVKDAQDLWDIQKDILESNWPTEDGQILSQENRDARDYQLLSDNAEYAALCVRFPGYKFIEVDLEAPEMYEDEEVEDDVHKLGKVEFEVEIERILDMDVNRDFSNRPGGHSLNIGYWNGIVFCSDHDCGGGCRWGYAVVKDGKLIWDGEVPDCVLEADDEDGDED